MPAPVKRLWVEFNGERYYRDNDGYYKSSRSRGRHLLHRDIWEAANGPIPPGHEIHHRDHDRGNNDPANLTAVTRAHHLQAHGGARGYYAWSAEERSARSKVLWTQRQPRTVTCLACGVEFQSVGMRATFCTKPCRRRYYMRERGY